MPRAYALTDWSTQGPRVLELKKAGKSFKAIEEIIGVKQEAIRAWFNKQAKAKASPTQEPPMNVQFDPLPTDPVTVLEGQLSIEDADTPAEVHYGAVHEFDALPAGYTKEIQPMRKYTEAEEWALEKSIELYGFQGAIVRDQYGRILDGHHRQRLARLRGLGVPHTITHVRDDTHAMEIARALNINRRHHSQEEREELAVLMRDQGFSYRAIADALKVGVSTVYRDVFGLLQERHDTTTERAGVPNETADAVRTESGVPNETPDAVRTESGVPNETPTAETTDTPVSHETPAPEQRIRGRDQKSYPSKQPKRSNGTKVTTSPADRQLAQVINLLMSHAQQWNDQHWQAFLEVVQNLRGSRAVPAAE